MRAWTDLEHVELQPIGKIKFICEQHVTEAAYTNFARVTVGLQMMAGPSWQPLGVVSVRYRLTGVCVLAAGGTISQDETSCPCSYIAVLPSNPPAPHAPALWRTGALLERSALSSSVLVPLTRRSVHPALACASQRSAPVLAAQGTPPRKHSPTPPTSPPLPRHARGPTRSRQIPRQRRRRRGSLGAALSAAAIPSLRAYSSDATRLEPDSGRREIRVRRHHPWQGRARRRQRALPTRQRTAQSAGTARRRATWRHRGRAGRCTRARGCAHSMRGTRTGAGPRRRRRPRQGSSAEYAPR